MPILLAIAGLMSLGVLLRMLFTLMKGGAEAQAAAPEPTRAAAARPNFLVFLLDDLEVDLLQSMLDANLLPNIKNKIVNGAFEFQNAYAPCPICTPSRASFLTGKYAHNTDVWHVTGAKGPVSFDRYLATSGNAYLPTWLGSEYHRAFIGKTHLGFNYPNWDFFRPVNGYDLRPGMYRSVENGHQVYPEVYQTKYIGDSAKEAIRSAGNKPYFLLVAPTAIHVNVFNWRRMEGYNNDSFSGTPVSFSQFHEQDVNRWRQHLVTVEYIGVTPLYKWWSRDSQFRDSGWGNWSFIGEGETLAPETGSGVVVGWNVLNPEPNLRRQQLVKARGAEVGFYTRDLVQGGTPRWVPSGDQSVLAGTGSQPLVAWTAITFPSGLIRQQIVRGTPVNGYTSYVRYREGLRGTFTSWQIDPDWGETVAFGTLRGFNLIPTSGTRYIIQLLLQPPGATRFEWWQSPEIVDHQELAATQSGSGPIAIGRSRDQDLDILEEGEQLQQPFMKFSRKRHTLQEDMVGERVGESTADLLNMEEQAATVSQIHPYYLMRAYAEGSWSPILPGQTYDWGGNYPAGSLRKNRAIHGFNAANSRYDLPTRKPSYNRRLDCPVPFYSTDAWPGLKVRVWGKKDQEDYLRRLYLDRQEQMLSIDRMVGEVVDAAGSNTIVVFTSDNGHFNGEHRLANKLSPQEESIRVPLYIKVPHQVGRSINHLVANVDLAPTVMHYAGKSWTDPRYSVDGRSLRPLIENPNFPYWRKMLLLEYAQPRGENYASTDWRFGLPDYLGLRFGHQASKEHTNSLYVQYYDNFGVHNSVFAYERYLMNDDPYQIRNVATGKLPLLERRMRELLFSSGQSFRSLEAADIPSG